MRRFSLQAYRAVIEAALASGYRFQAFDRTTPAPGGAVYLRHDVDYTLSMAAELARVNADLGVRGTFMLLLRSHAYNLLSPASLRAARELVDLGQAIGFHALVPEPLPQSIDDLADRIRGDFLFLQQNLPEIEAVFSWHNPSAEVLELTSRRGVIGGLVNAYSAGLTREITYLSDSNMRNRPDELLTYFRSAGRASVQLLVHPLNWVAGGAEMDEVFAGTWSYLIRETEVELRTNRWYAEAFPDGMPRAVLEGFATSWRAAAAARAPDRLMPRPAETS